MNYPLIPSLMQTLAINEEARLQALEELEILDTPREEAFERISRLAKVVMNTPIVTISLIDRHRQWLKSSIGMNCSEIPRDISFCDRTIQRDVPLIIPDTRLDPDYQNSPFVLGEPHLRFYMGIPLRTTDGFNVGTLCIMDQVPREPKPEQVAVMQDLAGLVVGELELRQLADSDCLTGAMSRRSFMREGKRAVAQSVRTHSPLSCMALDIDHFKLVNDQYGHAAGDLVLQAVAAACQRIVRSMDIFGRIGGEEFAAFLPEAAMADAAASAERFRQEIAALLVDTESGPVRLTASFGVSSRNGRNTSVDALLAEADGALYEAKRGGRNQVAVVGGAKRLALPVLGSNSSH